MGDYTKGVITISVMVFMAGAAVAQDQTERPRAPAKSRPAATATAPTPSIIGAVSLSGADDIGFATFARAYEPYIGQPADPSVLQNLARTLADTARGEGYLFATAVVPEQAIAMGVVRVRVELGAIDEVRVVGSDNPMLRRILAGLVGPAPKAAAVERRLLLAGDLPGVTVLGTRYQRVDGRGVLEVQVAELKLRGLLTVDNQGPRAYGPVRARFSGSAFNLGLPGSQFSVQGTRALDGNELSYLSARYNATFGDGAGLAGVNASISRSKPGGAFTFPLAGRSDYAAAYASWNLLRSRQRNAWLNGELAYLANEQSAAGARFQDERTLTLTGSVSGNERIADGRVFWELGATRGLLPGRRLGAISAGPAPSMVFTRANGSLSYYRPLGPKASVRLTARGQLTDRPLPNSQQIGLGGPAYGRAYDFDERFGDSGYMVSAEYARALGNKGLQAFVFADAGHVYQRGGDRYGEGSLASAGGGLRYQSKRWDADVYLAAPLNEDRFATGDRCPRLGVTVTWKF